MIEWEDNDVDNVVDFIDNAMENDISKNDSNINNQKNSNYNSSVNNKNKSSFDFDINKESSEDKINDSLHSNFNLEVFKKSIDEEMNGVKEFIKNQSSELIVSNIINKKNIKINCNGNSSELNSCNFKEVKIVSTYKSIEKGEFIDEKQIIPNEVNSTNNNIYKIQNSQKFQFADSKEWQGQFPWDNLVIMANKLIFGHNKFKTNQKEIINSLLKGRDVFVNMPTGGGKSLAFQLSAAICSGVTIVIMPLISLINDQIRYLNSINLKNIFLKDDFHFEKNFIYKNFETSNLTERIKLIYLTPEKLFLSESTFNFVNTLYIKGLIDRFVIDEVHCLAQWGKDFRPEYLNLSKLKEDFPLVPLLAMTATANIDARDEIIEFLNLKNCLVFRSSYNRSNIYLEVKDKTKCSNPLKDISNFIRSTYPNGSGIIYCSSRKECESIANKLKIDYKFSADFYHSTISEGKKNEVQENFMNGNIQILAATIAFGMGINKENIRFVIHYSLPKSFENYYQEIGRAGRDQKKSHAILYYNINERRTLDFLLSKSGGDSKIKSSNLRKINQIIAFCEEKAQCRRVLALSYFGEVFKEEKCDLMCDNCNNYVEVVDVNVTSAALKVICFFEYLKKYRFKMTINQASNYLKGNKIDKFKNVDYIIKKDSLYFSFLKDWEIHQIAKLIRTLIIKYYLCEVVESYYENVCCYLELDVLGEKYLRNRKSHNAEDFIDLDEEDIFIVISFAKSLVNKNNLTKIGCYVISQDLNEFKIKKKEKKEEIYKNKVSLIESKYVNSNQNGKNDGSYFNPSSTNFKNNNKIKEEVEFIDLIADEIDEPVDCNNIDNMLDIFNFVENSDETNLKSEYKHSSLLNKKKKEDSNTNSNTTIVNSAKKTKIEISPINLNTKSFITENHKMNEEISLNDNFNEVDDSKSKLNNYLSSCNINNNNINNSNANSATLKSKKKFI